MTELHYLLRYLKKQEIKEQYARNTLGLMLRALWPKLNRALYSEFVEALEEPPDTRSGQEVVNDLIAELDRRRAKRQRESDERERKQVYDWLMGGDTENGSIHTHCEAGT